MYVLRKIYCRAFQLAFRAALPFLPYRNPEIISSDAEIPAVLRRMQVSESWGLLLFWRKLWQKKELDTVSMTGR